MILNKFVILKCTHMKAANTNFLLLQAKNLKLEEVSQ